MSNKKVYSFHFPEKHVYVNSTCYPLEAKLEIIKKDKDHKLYLFLQLYPNPEIREEGDDNSVSVKEVQRRYYEDWYTLIGRDWFPFSEKRII